MTITPPAQASNVLDFGVRVLYVILDRQAGWIEDTHVTSEPKKDTRRFKSKEPRVRAREALD